MTDRNSGPLGLDDYPLAEKRPDLVKGRRGLGADDITLANVLTGAVVADDLSITAGALHQQAAISRAAGRSTLAQNFERAAEMVDIPQDMIMRTYELLRPGRAKTKSELLDIAKELGSTYKATRLAAFVTEAAEVYEQRGLFKRRY